MNFHKGGIYVIDGRTEHKITFTPCTDKPNLGDSMLFASII